MTVDGEHVDRAAPRGRGALGRFTLVSVLVAAFAAGCAGDADPGRPTPPAHPANGGTLPGEGDAGAAHRPEPGGPPTTTLLLPPTTLTTTTTATATATATATGSAPSPPACLDQIVNGDGFETDSDALPPATRSELVAVAERLRGFGDVEVHVYGHADLRPSRRGNQALSEARARAAAAVLITSGVPAQRITVEGRGDREPVTHGDTSDDLARNRRIHVVARCRAPADR